MCQSSTPSAISMMLRSDIRPSASLVVEPKARGRGVGRALTEECIERALQDGAQLISLHTSPAMETARAMYQRMGFSLAKALPDRFGVPYAVYTLAFG